LAQDQVSAMVMVRGVTLFSLAAVAAAGVFRPAVALPSHPGDVRGAATSDNQRTASGVDHGAASELALLLGLSSERRLAARSRGRTGGPAGALAAPLLGAVAVVAAFAVLWYNERRSVRMEALIDKVADAGVEVHPDRPSRDHVDVVVCVSGDVVTADRLSCELRGVQIRAPPQCTKLRVRVEEFVRSTDNQGHKSCSWKQVECEQKRARCAVGQFVLSDDQIDKLDFGHETDLSDSTILVSGAGWPWRNGYLHLRGTGGTSDVGDIRLSATHAACGTITVVGVQEETQSEGQYSFGKIRFSQNRELPTFGPAPTTAFNFSREGNYAQVADDHDDRSSSQKESVASMSDCKKHCESITFLLPVHEQSLSLEEVVQRERASQGNMTVLFRLLGWLLLWVGLELVLSPVSLAGPLEAF